VEPVLAAPESLQASDLALSPNHGERAGGAAPDCVVLHYTGMASAEAALAWLRNPRSQVSCHYFVWEDGRVSQLVAESRRAWHAGVSFWKGARDLNSASIGIEIANPGHEFGAPPFPGDQIAAVIALCRDLCARRRIAPERVLAHSDIAPARKRDPGEAFPWAALHKAGVAHWVPPAPIGGDVGLRVGDSGQDVAALQDMLARYGYEAVPSGHYDQATENVVRAFQRRFRPARVDGAADRSTVETLRRLIAAPPPAAR
jgi:N-acetylmuramoyl-L-alanine amidase